MVQNISEYWYLEMLLPGIFGVTMECHVNYTMVHKQQYHNMFQNTIVSPHYNITVPQ